MEVTFETRADKLHASGNSCMLGRDDKHCKLECARMFQELAQPV